MSRIFDALQRSGTEQSGIEYPDMVSVAREVLEAEYAHPARPTESLVESELSPIVPIQPVSDQTVRVEIENSAKAFPEFPSLNINVPPSSRLVFLSAPESLAAEKFRFLGVRLRQMQLTRPLKKVLITSTIPEEGKSLVSANLAGVLAKRKQKVLLLEGDLRRPTLAEKFGLPRLAGLGEWLRSNHQTLSNIYRLNGTNLWLMPAGDSQENPLELMQSGKLSRLVEQLSGMFDWILVDSPPLLPLADTTVWSRLSDGALLVVREGTTEKAPLQRGLESLKKPELLGVVMNGSTESDHDNYYQRYAPSGSN